VNHQLTVTLLGKRLMQLNRMAMDERYPDRHADRRRG
jgi:hypothetical protein